MTFALYRKIQGRPERITIGRFPEITVEQARNRVRELVGDIARGANPARERQRLRKDATLGELFAQYLDEHAKPRKRSWQRDVQQYERYLAAWARRKLSAVTRDDVRRLHRQIGNKGKRGRPAPYAANRLLALIHALYAFAQSEGWRGENPAKGVQKHPEQERERFLQADELPSFFRALADEPSAAFRDLFLLCLLTGARRGNVMAMRWEDLHLERATWTIPMTKNRKPHTLPLVPEAVAVLAARQATAHSEWVFPAESKSGHMIEPRKAWLRIVERAGLGDLRIHDLRRSLASWQAATGASLPIIGRTLAHRNPATTAIYARLELDPVRQAMETATAAMLRFAPTEPSE